MKKMSIFIVFVCTIFLNNVIAATGWLFKTEEEAKEAFSTSEIKSITIADPSYDQTFKKILSTSEESKDRLMSFLNSLYYPNEGEDGLKIREIVPLDKEITQMGEKSKAGVLFCDIACKCICCTKDEAMIDSAEDNEDDLKSRKKQKTSNKKRYTFDIEMQRGVDTELVGRMQQYISGLKSIHGLPVEGLGLLNYDSNAEDIVKVYNYCEIDANSKEFKAKRIVGGKANLPIRTIYLGKVNGNVEIIFDGNELDDLGVSWLKLLGLKNWATSVNTLSYKIFFPENEIDSNIKETLEILSKIDQATLNAIENQEQYTENVQTGVIQNAFIKDRINLVKSGDMKLKRALETLKLDQGQSEEFILRLKNEDYDLESLKQQVKELAFLGNWKDKIKAKLDE